jgi:predicted dehydrogenase
MKLKAALIGCGRIGTKKHLEAYIANREEVSVEIILGIYRSFKEKRPIFFPLQEFRSVDMIGTTF